MLLPQTLEGDKCDQMHSVLLALSRAPYSTLVAGCSSRGRTKTMHLSLQASVLLAVPLVERHKLRLIRTHMGFTSRPVSFKPWHKLLLIHMLDEAYA